MMLKCVLIDDEPLAREVLMEYLGRLGIVDSIQQFSNASDALGYFQRNEADVLFLDIEMPGITGIDFLSKLSAIGLSNPPITVFTTAYRNYAFEGFELGVIDFLLKPIAYPRFLQAIDKVRDFLALKDQNTRLENGPGEALPESIMVKSGVQRIKLHFNEVTYIQGLKDYAIIHTTTTKIVIKGSIKAMQEIFPESQFLRVHKSFMAAMAHITRIERNRLIVNGHQIPIGRNYKEAVDKALFDYRKL